MKELLKTQKLYESAELQEFIRSLEESFPVEPDERFERLVNFSDNRARPYHQWFCYREGFAGELISRLLAMSGARPGEYIIDPFCGSGTTNTAAALNGYHTLGLDVNPMSAFLTGMKVAHYSEEDLALAERALVRLDSFSPAKSPDGREDLARYFPPENFIELLRIRSFLDSLPDSKAKDILLAAFLSVILDCSCRKRDGNGLKTCSCRVADPADHFARKVLLITGDIRGARIPSGVRGYGVWDTALHLADRFRALGGDARAGAVIFSPPYANSFDYFESYKLELILGGFVPDRKGIGALRKKAVRSFVGAGPQPESDQYVDLIAREIEAALPEKERETGRPDHRTRKVPDMLRGYFADMRQALCQCALCLEPARKTYIVVDQSAYLGRLVPTDLLLAYLAGKEGFAVGRILQCGRARTSTQQLNRYPYLKTALRRSIVELIRQ